MRIPIELLMVVIAMIVIGCIIGLLTLSKWISIRRYKPENDKGKQGEDRRKSGFGDLQATLQSKRRSVFSIPTSPRTNINKKSSRKTLNPFRRR